MDSIEQASGEKRVREILVEGLLKRGLAKPSRLTKDQFEASVDDLCKRLAYMTTANLEALQEVAAARPGGKLRDQMPIANAILDMASDIQAPPEDASPLIRAVFASALGADALAGGWAPELLGELRRNRRWPNAWTVSQIKTDAEPNVRCGGIGVWRRCGAVRRLRNWQSGRAANEAQHAGFHQGGAGGLCGCGRGGALWQGSSGGGTGAGG